MGIASIRAIIGYQSMTNGSSFPDHAVVDNYGNPTGDAVVWYTEFKDAVFIRCFVHGGGL